jgi:hypothetical protein
MVQITARAHRQMLGDPPHRHRRLRPHPLAHLCQQLLPKLLLAQTSTAPNRLELLAGLSSGIPHSPSNRSTRNHAGRFAHASKYAGQLLQAKLLKGASAATSSARAGFKWT